VPVEASDAMTSDDKRNTMAVALFYDTNKTMAFIIEVKICIISKCDPDSIEAAHQTTMEAATQLVQSYRWYGPTVATEKRVIVSGVWYNVGSFQLSTSVKFVESGQGTVAPSHGPETKNSSKEEQVIVSKKTGKKK
jgi:hypothetical protein